MKWKYKQTLNDILSIKLYENNKVTTTNFLKDFLTKIELYYMIKIQKSFNYTFKQEIYDFFNVDIDLDKEYNVKNDELISYIIYGIFLKLIDVSNHDIKKEIKEIITTKFEKKIEENKVEFNQIINKVLNYYIKIAETIKKQF